MDINTLLYIAIAVTIILIVWNIRLEIKLKRLLGGRLNAKSIEDALRYLSKDIQELSKHREISDKKMNNLNSRLRRCIQAVETIRFNPFKGTGAGGNQSFSSSFINEEGDGVIISTLNARDRMSIFSKPIKGFSSEHELSEEEQEVITRARNKIINE